jgi:hypothetical protein
VGLEDEGRSHEWGNRRRQTHDALKLRGLSKAITVIGHGGP